MGSEIHLRATLGEEEEERGDAYDDGGRHRHRRPRVKPPPQSSASAISAPFSYSPSDDGTDENLLVLLHGLGSFLTHLFPFRFDR